MLHSVIVHYQEIALKGRNRPWFVGHLIRNLRQATEDLDVRQVRALVGRIEVATGPGIDLEVLKARIRHVFGIANFASAGRASLDIEELASAIVADLGDRQVESFRVSARRADKRFPMTSPEIERRIGRRIQLDRGWRVDLDNPELNIQVEILRDEAFFSFAKEPGPGGLPTGTGGRLVCLLSGGIDSPVAAYRLMRRGCVATMVHFHSYPFLSHASQDKVRELAGLLTMYQQRMRVHLVAFGEIQRQVVLSVPGPLRVVVYRRLMLRIAERIALEAGARALVTGEAIGQVASQTLENMTVIGAASSLPILRPLIGMDKDEITAEAQRLGTFPISTIPDQDCCTLFTPKHPKTKARLRDIEDAERAMPIDEFVTSAVSGAVVEDFQFPRLQCAVPEGSAG